MTNSLVAILTLGIGAQWLAWKMQIPSILIGRPLSILLATPGSRLTVNERLFLAWCAPRGIVAAAVAALFSLQLEHLGAEGAEVLVPVTFSVIIGTVTIYGLSALPVARYLGLANADPHGMLIVGGHPAARRLASLIREENQGRVEYPVHAVHAKLPYRDSRRRTQSPLRSLPDRVRPASLGMAMALLLSGCTLGSFNDIKGSTSSSTNGTGGGTVNGVTFATPTNVSLSHESGADASLLEQNVILDPLGGLHVIYEEFQVTAGRQVMFVEKSLSGTFSTPVTISQADQASGLIEANSSRLAVTPSGVAHMVWQQGSLSNTSKIFYATNRSGAFEDPLDVSATTGGSATPSIRVDGSGDAHIVFLNTTQTMSQIVYVSVFNGSASNPVVVSDGVTPVRFDSRGLAVDVGTSTTTGSVEILWSQTPVGQNTRIVHRRRTGGFAGTFSGETDISLLAGSDHGPVGDFDTDPECFFDASGGLHVLFVHNGVNVGNLMRNYRAPGGSFLANAHDVSGLTSGDASNAGRAVDSVGNLFVLYEEKPLSGDSILHFKAFANQEDPQAITPIEIDTMPRFLSHALGVALDSVGQVHLAWEFENATSSRDIRYRIRTAGDNLTSIESVAASSLDERFQGLVATPSGRSFLVFAQDISGPGDADILVRTRDSASSASVINLSSTDLQESQDGVLRLDISNKAQVLWLESFTGLKDVFHSSGN